MNLWKKIYTWSINFLEITRRVIFGTDINKTKRIKVL